MRDDQRRADAGLALDVRVHVYSGTDAEGAGVIVEDFGELAGQAVYIGDRRITPARRWAVQLDSGSLVFADTEHLVRE